MNDENLKKGKATQFRSGEEAVRNGKKGGEASGISRSFKSALKKKIKNNPEITENIINVLLDEANKHNLKAIEMVLSLNDDGQTELDRKIKRAQLDKIKAETEAIKKSGNDKIDTENNLIEILKAGGTDDLDETE